MAIALLTVNMLSQIGLVATIVMGYLYAGATADFRIHFTLALISTIAALLAHCMTMFYFVGTGKIFREFSIEHGFERELRVRERTREMKFKLFPITMIATVMIVVVFVIGGGVHTRVVPVWVHNLLALLALALHIAAFLTEVKFLVANNTLNNEVTLRASQASSRS